MRILEEVEVVLRTDQFSTVRLRDTSVVAFESDTIFGFVLEYSNTDELLASWQTDQSRLLERFAPALRTAGTKAWNVYCVFLTEGQSDDSKIIFELETIEENLRHTRKIPRQGIRSAADVKVALAPIMSITSQGLLIEESFDERLLKKLEGEIGKEATASFFGTAEEEAVARALAEKAQ